MANNLDWSYHYIPPCSWLDYYGISVEQYRKHVADLRNELYSDSESKDGQSDEEDLLSFAEDEQSDEDLLFFTEKEEECHTVEEVQAKNSSVLMTHTPTNQDIVEVAVQQQSNQELLDFLNS